MRLFSAFVSVADASDDELLETLEATDPPEILFSDHLAPRARQAFVPANIITRTKHGVLVGRTNRDRFWARVVPKSPVVVFRWPSLVLATDDHQRLKRLCKRVAYLGRSTCPCIVEVNEDQEIPELLCRHTPSGRASESGFRYVTTVRCPFPGSLRALRLAHESKYEKGQAGDPWQIGLWIDYGSEDPTGPAGSHSGVYRETVVFKLVNRSLDGRHTAAATLAMRRALLSRAEEHIAPLHGHHNGEVVQVAVVGLPFVGQQNADGHLLGIAVLIPELRDTDLQILARALPPPGERMKVTAGPLGTLELERITPLDAERLAWALQPRRWRGPACRWCTVLPMVFDRFLKKRTPLDEEVKRAVVNSGLPEPTSIQVSRRPLVYGGVDLAPRDTIRRRGDKGFKPYRHVLLSFDRPIEGPIVIGSMRHYGLGLCVPLPDDGSRRQ